MFLQLTFILITRLNKGNCACFSLVIPVQHGIGCSRLTALWRYIYFVLLLLLLLLFLLFLCSVVFVVEQINVLMKCANSTALLSTRDR